MYGLTIFQRHHAQMFSQLRDENPVANASVGLDLTMNWGTQCSIAPFTSEIWTFPYDLLFKVTGCLHLYTVIVLHVKTKSQRSPELDYISHTFSYFLHRFVPY